MLESLQDPILGLLRWDERLQWWIGETHWTPGRSIEFFISPGEDTRDAVLVSARAGLERIRGDVLTYRRWTAEQVADSRWNSDEKMTVEEITSLLRLASIDF
jgi:hypothetical protein